MNKADDREIDLLLDHLNENVVSNPICSQYETTILGCSIKIFTDGLVAYCHLRDESKFVLVTRKNLSEKFSSFVIFNDKNFMQFLAGIYSLMNDIHNTTVPPSEMIKENVVRFRMEN